MAQPCSCFRIFCRAHVFQAKPGLDQARNRAHGFRAQTPQQQPLDQVKGLVCWWGEMDLTVNAVTTAVGKACLRF